MTRGRDDAPSRGDEPTLAAPSSSANEPTLAAGTQVSLASDATAAAGSSASRNSETGLTTVPASTYTILGEHGRGGLGRILRARDQRTGRVVAIKEMLPGAEEAAPRFVREALVTANLQHPAIVPVYEVGRWPDGQPFYAMKLVAGHTLTDAIAKAKDLAGRLALLPHVAAVADALAYAHEAGVIHRDLKPHNVLVGAHGETVVIDWGLAKTGDDNEIPLPEIATGETVSGAVMGTPAYMPPEQAAGVEVDARADVYAIGAMLYHLLAGVPPYADSRNAAEVITKVREGQPPRALPSLVAEVPQDLAAIVGKSMSHATQDRYPSASELAADLRTFMTGGLVGAHRYTRRQRLGRFVRRHRAAVAIGAIAMLALGGFGGYSVKRIMSERDAAEVAKQESIARLAISYEQRARTELISARADRALPLVVEAMRLGRDDAAIRFVAQRAAEQLPAPSAAFVGTSETAQFAPHSHDVLIVDGKHVIRLDSTADRVVWRTPLEGGLIMSKVSKDQSLIVSAPGKLVLLGLGDGKPLGELRWPTQSPMRGITRGAGLIAAIDADGRAVVWEEATRKQLQSMELHANLMDPQISPDGKRLLIGAMNMEPQTSTSVFEIATGRKLFDVCADPKPCSRPVFLPNGNILAYLDSPQLSEPGAVMMFDAEGKQLWRRETARAVVAARQRDGGVLVGIAGGLVESLDLATGARRWHRQLATAVEHVFITDDVIVAVEPKGFSVLARDGAAELVRYTVDLAATKLLFPDDLQRVGVVDHNHGIRIARLDRKTDIVTGQPGLRMLTAIYSRDGKYILAGNHKGVIAFYDAVTGTLAREMAAHDKTVASLETDAPGRRLLSGSPDTHARIWNLATGEKLVDVVHGDTVRIARFSPDEKRFLTAGKDATIARWDAATGAPIGARFKLTSRIVGAAWSSDGRHIAAIDEDGYVGIWNAETGTEVRALKGGDLGIGSSIAWSPDGRHLAVARHDTAPKLLGVGAPDVSLDASDAAELIGVTLAFDGPGRRLAMGATDGRIRIWDAATGKRLTTIETAKTTWVVAWHPEGHLIASGDRDGFIRVWTEGGDELAQRRAPAEVVSLQFSPDGNSLAAASIDQGLVWRIPAWTGTATELEELARCVSGWEIQGDRVVWAHRPLRACGSR